MTANTYEGSIQQFKKMLGQLDQWLEKAVAHAQKKSFDPNVLVQARLAPDQYPLVRQVQSSCDTAKFAAARLTGKEAPKHPDTEQTIEELRARVRSCIAFLDTVKSEDYAASEGRRIELPFLEGKILLAVDYLREMATPNFYFHLTHAYAILRHNGVDLGKMDYIGSLSTKDR
ncbi:MAG TPA: DUF1993 domain-containing protein [Polyangiaceae bacterium]|jgi:hypothetical protein